jgi:hypothetical protein
MAYQEIQNKQNGEKGLSARTKINSMFQELYAAVGGFVSSLSNYFTKTELSESGAGGTVHWDNVTNKRVGKLSDTDGDTYIDVESTPDVDLINIISAKTSGSVLNIKDGNGNVLFEMSAGTAGLLRLYYNVWLISFSAIAGLARSSGYVLLYPTQPDVSGINHFEARNGGSFNYSFRAYERNEYPLINSKVAFADNNGDASNTGGNTFTNYTSFLAAISFVKPNSILSGYKAFHAKSPICNTISNAYAFISESGMKSGFGTDSPTEMVDVLGNIKTSGIIKAKNLPIYADNTTALAGGLVAGDVYRTSTGELRITI